LSIPLGFAVSGLLVRPIEKLYQATRHIAEGKLDYKLEIKTGDEIEELAGSFQEMVLTLLNNQKQINGYTKELEASRSNLAQKVEERTLELTLEKEKLKQVNLDLERERKAIINMLKDLEEANKNLKLTQAQLIQSAKMASIGQLAAGLAHEINNPLTGVLNNVQLIKMEMERKADGISPAEFKEVLDAVEEAALRCKKITQSLLDFSRASKAANQPLSINEVIEKVTSLISQELRLQNITIQTNLAPQLPLTQGNFQLLQQVFMNFITNSQWAIRKKSATEGGTITIKTEYDSQKDRVNIYLSDTGIGMSSEMLNKIFEPFFTTKDVGEGTGLGLSVIYGIIQDHQGTIEVESEVDKGTTFKISLPAFQQKEGGDV
jgi:two-component system NtrC family sensor kinase